MQSAISPQLRLERLRKGAATFVTSESARAWLGLVVVAVLGFAAVYFVFRPGTMTLDSLRQLRQARSLVLRNDHPALMALLWAALDQVVPGPRGMLLFSNLLYWSGLVLTFRYWPLPNWGRILAFSIVAFFPPIFALLGVIWKDMLMQGALVALLGAYFRYRETKHAGWLVAIVGFAALAIGARHNAAAAAWPLLTLVAIEHPRLAQRAWKPRLGIGAVAALAACLAVQSSLSLAMKPFVEERHYWQTVPIFDLAGMSVMSGVLLFDADSPALKPGMLLEDVRKAYDPRSHMRLYACKKKKNCVAPCEMTLDTKELAALTRNWKRAIWEHPDAYLRHRIEVYRELIGLTSRPPQHFTASDIIGNEFGYRMPKSKFREAVFSKLYALSATPLFSVWLYLVASWIALGFSAWGIWTGRAPLPFAVVSSGLLYNLSYLPLTGSPDFRYSVWTILSTLLAIFALPSAWPGRVLAEQDEELPSVARHPVAAATVSSKVPAVASE